MELLQDDLEQIRHIDVDSYIVSEFETILGHAFVQLGMEWGEAITSAKNYKDICTSEFVEKAVDFDMYRSRIIGQPYGISPEAFTHMLAVDPGQVIADASHWASIYKQQQAP